MAQELLATFAEELGSVTLTPDVTGGVFEIRLDGEMIWSRKDKGRFPEIKEIKRLVRTASLPVDRSGMWTSRSEGRCCPGLSSLDLKRVFFARVQISRAIVSRVAQDASGARRLKATRGSSPEGN